MNGVPSDCEALRVNLDRVRAMLEGLVVRGLRACGAEELAKLKAFADDLERSGAGQMAGVLNELHGQMEKDDRGAAKTLLAAQVSVRLLERLLTLRVVKGKYAAALAGSQGAAAQGDENTDDDYDKGEDGGEA